MSPSEKRIQQLSTASEQPDFTKLIGRLSEADLSDWLAAELGRPDALDAFDTHGNIRSKAVAPETILHIVSGNTPHAALQSLFRGLIIGSQNAIKLPSNGIPELHSWIESLPDELRQTITLIDEPSDSDWNSADTIIAIGSDSTIASIQQRILPHQSFIPHGHKVSIGIVAETSAEAATLAAKDVSLFDQHGCLSLHAIYVDESDGHSSKDFAQQLAKAMAEFSTHTPPQTQSLSEAGAIHNFRETTRFLAANTDTTELLESKDSLDWTVVYQQDPTLHLSCLGRCVTVSPLPDPLNLDTLGPEARHLSTIALHPFEQNTAESISHLPAHRICPLGQSQQPSLFWHHDGFAPLASLIKWKDIG